MIAAALIDNVVRRSGPLLLRNAESLVGVVAWPDYPDGLAVVEPPGGFEVGFSIGSGHLLAEAIGHRFRPAAVAVGAAAMLRIELLAAGLDEPEDAVARVWVDVEVIALHEAAHAIVAPLDAPGDAKRIAACRAVACDLGEFRPAEWIASHGPAWALAYATLCRRAFRFRPNTAQAMRTIVAADMAAHGIDADLLFSIAAEIGDEARLRKLVHRADLLGRAAAAVAPDAERIASVEKVIARPRAGRGSIGDDTKGAFYGDERFESLEAAHGEAARCA
jgi:hypothetical protein